MSLGIYFFIKLLIYKTFDSCPSKLEGVVNGRLEDGPDEYNVKNSRGEEEQTPIEIR